MSAIKSIIKSDLGKIWAHKNCKSMFMDRQPDLPAPSGELNETENIPIDDSVEDDELDQSPGIPLRQSERKKYTYKSGWMEEKERKAIICNGEKRTSNSEGRPVPLVTVTDTDRTEDTLKEFAKIHIQHNTKYVDGAKRILLTLATSSLLASVAYHREECYIPFRSHHWKKGYQAEVVINHEKEETSPLEEFFQLVKGHVLFRRLEVYLLVAAQLISKTNC